MRLTLLYFSQCNSGWQFFPCGTMEFKLDDFKAHPTLAQVDACRVVDLMMIAGWLGVDVPPATKKAELRELVVAALQEESLIEITGVGEGASEVISEPSAAVAHPTGLAESSNVSGMSAEELRLTFRIKEMEVRHRELEVEAMQLKVKILELEHQPKVPPQSRDPSETSHSPHGSFDVSRHIALVPPFRETEVDSYFNAFERIAAALNWPKDVWSLLLQCKLTGKAQEVCAALSVEQSLNYDVVKTTVLRAYELVPEAYRQKFRKCEKSVNQTYVEFAREKGALFDKWCQASKTKNFAQLRELVLLEEFKKCLPERIVVYLNEQKVVSLSEAAVLADEFALTHKSVFVPPVRRDAFTTENKPRSPKASRRNTPAAVENRACFYCRESGHFISACPTLKKKEQNKNKEPSAVVLIQRGPSKTESDSQLSTVSKDIDEDFKPFVSNGFLSLPGEEVNRVPVVILRDTCAKYSIARRGVLPFSNVSYCGSDFLVWGIGLSVLRVPVHSVNLTCPLVTGSVRIGVRDQLPVPGVDIILGNDLAGNKVFPSVPEVTEIPTADVCVFSPPDSPPVFPACVVTRARARKLGEATDLSDSFLCAPDNSGSPSSESKNVSVSVILPDDDLCLSVNREQLIEAQQADCSLIKCVSAARDNKCESQTVSYLFDEGVLLRRWCPLAGMDCDVVRQVVVPTKFRSQVLRLAHDHTLSGHLGIKKTYDRVLRYFFWPGLKADVANFCRSCHVCQISGKPNQVIPPAPLQPIPVIGEPFEHIIVDCVGPLPKTKAGNRYVLTMMCAATRFPEAVPLRTLRAKAVVKALVKFFSTFGLPKRIQSDQGSNFMSTVFSQVMRELSVKHKVSSAYHPESQGALERFHQTLKSMLKKFCVESNKEWDEGLPLLLFAIRETTQESLGFSPAELVFGHTVRGPLRLLRETWLSDKPGPMHSVLDYVSSFRERLHTAVELARSALSSVQTKMKKHFDKKALSRSFQPSDQVLALLPMVGSGFQAKFCGPYIVEKKLSDTDYVIKTPDRRKKFRVCHINMLKPYFDRQASTMPESSASPVTCVVPVASVYCPQEDGLRDQPAAVPTARLENSRILERLEDYLSHLSESARTDVCNLICENVQLFGDKPTQTTILTHDVDVGDHQPIKQHAYRVNPTKRAVMSQEVDYLIENGFAVPSCSPWSSPSLVVPKSDRTPRFCTDYRKVNAITKSDSFPLPRMDDCVDRVGSAKFVTKLDLLKGYWQVPLTARASEISAFVTPDHFLQYTVMPFGLKNAPATFQRLVNTVLSGVKNCEAYLDDIVVYSSTWAEHMCTLQEVFRRLREASLTVNLAKCEFGKAMVTYLGKHVGQGQVRPLAAKVQAILDFPVPESRRQLRRFLGMCGYYRGFCKNFASVVCPLTSLTSPSKSFVWTDACQESFDAAKALLCSAPVLTAPDFSRPFKVEVDASAHGAGAILVQEHEEGVDHPVCFFSKKFDKHQLHYSTIEKETLALLWALQHFEVYVGSSPTPVQVFTDHNPLVFLSRMRNHNSRLMRWSLLMQDFNVEIRHIKGANNIVADALSRAGV